MKTISKLAVGPMSEEIIESVYSYSELRKTPLMLISSKNQVDYDRGYVATTSEYRKLNENLKVKYPFAKVFLCRDHCGPGHNSVWDLDDTYRTIYADLENKFDLIHIDFCLHKGAYEEILRESKKAIRMIQKESPTTLIEIGTDENNGIGIEDLVRVEDQMKYFTEICSPHFFVTQTGSLIREINQEGMFHEDYIKKLKLVSNRYKLRLKEHNADYLPATEIKKRQGLIDAVNIAPQLGILQTKLTLFKSTLYGIDTSAFLNTSYRSRKWEKWLKRNGAQNKLLCATIAGHYNFKSDEYKRLLDQLNGHENINTTIATEMHKLFDLYLTNLG